MCIFFLCSASLTSYLTELEKLVGRLTIMLSVCIPYTCPMPISFCSDPVTRGLSITVNWLGIQVDVSELSFVFVCIICLRYIFARPACNDCRIYIYTHSNISEVDVISFSASLLGRVLVSACFFHTSWHNCHYISQGPTHYTH